MKYYTFAFFLIAVILLNLILSGIVKADDLTPQEEVCNANHPNEHQKYLDCIENAVRENKLIECIADFYHNNDSSYVIPEEDLLHCDRTYPQLKDEAEPVINEDLEADDSLN